LLLLLELELENPVPLSRKSQVLGEPVCTDQGYEEIKLCVT